MSADTTGPTGTSGTRYKDLRNDVFGTTGLTGSSGTRYIRYPRYLKQIFSLWATGVLYFRRGGDTRISEIMFSCTTGPTGNSGTRYTWCPRYLKHSQRVCMGGTLSLGWLGKPEPRSGGAVYLSNHVRHSNQARRALVSRRPHSNRMSSNCVRHSNQPRRDLGSRRPHLNRVSSNRVQHTNQTRRALGSRRPHSNRVSLNRVRQLS